jgi:hypothetical protein
MDWACDLAGGDQKCMPNFVEETSWIAMANNVKIHRSENKLCRTRKELHQGLS